MARFSMRGVSCEKYRGVLANLQDEGWRIRKTNGGHLKLTHPDAAGPVFGAFTPSDRRASLNLISDCNTAIRQQPRNEMRAESEISPKQCEDILRKNKQRRRRKDRSPFEQQTLKKPAAQPIEASQFFKPTAATATAIPPQAMPQFDAIPEKGSTAKKAPRPVHTVKAKSKPAAKAAQPSKPVEETVAPEEKDTTPMSTANATVQPAAPVTNVTPLPQKAAPQAAPAPAATKPAGVETVSADVLALAMKIASGEMQSLEITPEMVGQTMFFDGRLIMTDGAAPVAPAKMVAKNTATTRGASGLDARDSKLLSTLKEMGPDFVTLTDLTQLVWEELDFMSFASARASIVTRLRKLAKAGHVDEGAAEGKIAFRFVK
jgi:hypothetical protein